MHGAARQARPEGEPLVIRDVLAEMGAAYRERWRVLLGTGLLVFVPVGLVTAPDAPLEDADPNGVDLLTALEAGGLAAAQSVATVIGTVLYAGVVAAVVVARREGSRPPFKKLARTLPYGRLIAADVLVALVVAVGFLLLIVPGLVFLTWFALVAPAIETEHRGVLEAFRRSRQLVRPYFWKVAALVIPTLLAEELIASAVESGSRRGLGETFGGEWAGFVLGNLLAAPIFALAVVVLFHELRDRAPRAS